MAKKDSATIKSSKNTRLGHDPLADIEPPVTDEISQQHNTSSATEKNKHDNKATDKQDILDLPSRFSIASAEEVYKRMSSFVASEKDHIEVNAEKTESVDTSAIQLLYAFALQAKITGKIIHWKSHSSTIDDAAKILNIDILANTE